MSNSLINRRKLRIRAKLRKVSGGKVRMSVHRSNSHIYVQIIDDAKSITLTAASTLDPELKKLGKTGSNTSAAAQVGKLIAERAVSSGIKEVVFDRSGYLYHGRVKALADSARENGLSF